MSGGASLPEHPDTELTSYRPISLWAVMAWLFGMFSFVALVHPLLWIVPACGIVLALIALRRQSQAETPTLGRKAALCGLAISTCFGVAAPTWTLSRDYWLTARAEQLAMRYFQQFREGHPEQALALMAQSSFKLPAAWKDSPAYKGSEKRTELEQYLADPPIKQLVKLGPHLKVVQLAVEVSARETSRQPVGFLFEVLSDADPTQRPMRIAMYVVRDIDADGLERWQVRSVNMAKSTPID